MVTGENGIFRQLQAVKTPCYVLDEQKLLDNLKILDETAGRAGCKILLAQKAFAAFAVYPLLRRYLAGTTASSLFEARLGFEEMRRENHIFATAYKPEEMAEIITLCDHIVFNSFNQWQIYKDRALAGGISCGLRINPEYSTQEKAIYDPCAPSSRLGITRKAFRSDLLEGIEGLHFHTLCEQNSDALAATLTAVEEKFGEFLPQMKWVNFGGGHHITRADYDKDLLIDCIKTFKKKYDVEVYLEPGEAVALNAGYLVGSVLDIIQNDISLAVLDVSAACHMPDVLEMPYRPPLFDSGEAGSRQYTYRLTGPTCLAGDNIGDYSFDAELQIGDKLIFGDMAIYSMVKNNTFNGIGLPSIALLQQNNDILMIKEFAYLDFKQRLS